MDFSFLFLISMVVFILEQQEDINSYKIEMLPSPTTSMDHRTCNFSHAAAKAATVASERSSFSTVVPGSHANRSPSVNATPQIHRRERRCSCENLKDKECVYFCHIGIVWVDTPSQVIPYGVGSLQMRLRRNVERCQCTDKRDTKCVQFCSYLDLQHEDEKASVRRYHPRNYKERYNSRFTLRRPRNHNPIQTT